MRMGAVLLAAGASRRFGKADKLAQMLGEKCLGEYAASAIPRARFAKAWVITARGNHPCAGAWQKSGFACVSNPRADEGMGTSVALAAELARDAGLDAVLIALADMPMVPPSHFGALMDAVCSAGDIAASVQDSIPMPPAVFGSQHFESLSKLRGDKGARGLLTHARAITCPAEWLIDIDTPAALSKLIKAAGPPTP